jgi:hypothetical protein
VPLVPFARSVAATALSLQEPCAMNRLDQVAAAFSAEMLKQALAQRQTHQVLLDAVAMALTASATVAENLRGSAAQRLEEPPPATVMDQLRAGFNATAAAGTMSPDASLRLAEAIRELVLRHGAPAVDHCVRLVASLRELLDAVTGS